MVQMLRQPFHADLQPVLAAPLKTPFDELPMLLKEKEDRKDDLTDEDFLLLLSQRARCLDPECDSYFQFGPPLSSDLDGKCWNCGRDYIVSTEAHAWEVEDHGPMIVPVLAPWIDEGEIVRLISSEGEGWAFVEYMEWIGMDWEDFYESYLGGLGV